MYQAIPFDLNAGDNNDGDNNNNDGGGNKRRASVQLEPVLNELYSPEHDWDSSDEDAYVEEMCYIELDEEGIMPSDWHSFCMAQKENFPYVSELYAENFNGEGRRSPNLADPQDRRNFYLSPTCLEVIRKAYFADKGHKVKRVKFVPEIKADFPLLLFTDEYQVARFRQMVMDPYRKCYTCGVYLPQTKPTPPVQGDAQTPATPPLPPYRVSTLPLLRCPEETDQSYHMRTSILLCEPCFNKRYKELVAQSYMRYVNAPTKTGDDML